MPEEGRGGTLEGSVETLYGSVSATALDENRYLDFTAFKRHHENASDNSYLLRQSS